MDANAKRRQEKQTVSLMIDIYCRAHHGSRQLCPECAGLEDYALRRIDCCPFMETKTFCSSCPVHCYKKDMQERIRAVMRFSGPRMLLHHPVMALRHLMETKKQRKRTENTP